MASRQEKSRREEYTEATRQALLSAARELFTVHGYQGTGIEAVVQAARVTRGALYHHFADKKALFDAVVVQLQAEAAEALDTRARAERDRWARLRVGNEAYLDACLDPSYRRLVIQEAAAVLGLARYREIDEAYPLGRFITALESLKRAGELDFEDATLLARMIAAMMWEVALLLPDAPDADVLRHHAQHALDRILDAFRKR